MFKELLIYIATYIGLFVASFYVISLCLDRKKKNPEFVEMGSPKVSIIIPAYNEEGGIAGTLKSALEIDYPKEKLEIVFVDDGSKDNTYEIASKFKSERVKILKMSKNSGKGAAMNFAIKNSSGEIIVTMDADNTHVTKDALKKLVACFDSPDIVCVAPSMAIYNPKGVLQRVQQIEYLVGVFLRRAFSSVNAIHITPGAFSVYRKSFFDEYGGFDENNLTEDMEMSLRVQYHQKRLINNSEAVVYTVAPNKFMPLMVQRRRWYAGLLKNLWHYRALFSRKYGIMGVMVLPVAVISVVISILLTSVMAVDAIFKLKNEILLWESINFNLLDSFEFNKYIIERYLFLWFSDPIMIFFVLLVGLLIGYMVFAKKRVKQHVAVKLSLIFFLMFFSLLFVFWWIVSLFYVLANKKVVWR